MGRPINKRFIGIAPTSIKVSHYFRVGGSELTGDTDTYIVSQRSNNKFLVADVSGGWQEVLTLVDKDAGSLAEGEFRISGTTDTGEVVNVTRLYNRTLRGGNNTKFKWSAEGGGLEAPTISDISQANPAIVTVDSTLGLVTGDVITLSQVAGMVEVNDRQFTITVLDGTTFALDGEDSTGHTAYSFGGAIGGIGDSGSIDNQVIAGP